MLALLIVAFGLVVAGGVLIYLPAGLILAGILLAVAALFADPANLRWKVKR